MDNLPLASLQIEAYRLFSRLEIARLGRVNLITGRNNAGKTALLEAVRIYADRAAPRTILDILLSRDELVEMSDGQDLSPTLEGILSLFDQNAVVQPGAVTFRVGNLSDLTQLMEVGAGWIDFRTDNDTGWSNAYTIAGGVLIPSVETRPGVRVRVGSVEARFRLDRFREYAAGTMAAAHQDTLSSIPCVNVGPDGLRSTETAYLWDRVALTDQEEVVLEAIRTVAPEIERLSLVEGATTSSGISVSTGGPGIQAIPHSNVLPRTFRVRLRGRRWPVPLRSLGDGVRRVLGISLALATAENGILLLDELEDGLHYTVQPDLWKFIFRTAKALNVQVFVTTHSYDCVTAFQAAATHYPDQGVIIRLSKKAEQVTPTLFEGEELAVIGEEEIEVR